MNAESLEVFLQVEDVATMLQRSVRTVWRWRSAGIIPQPVKVSGTVLWNRAEILQWIADGCPDRTTQQLKSR